MLPFVIPALSGCNSLPFLGAHLGIGPRSMRLLHPERVWHYPMWQHDNPANVSSISWPGRVST